MQSRSKILLMFLLTSVLLTSCMSEKIAFTPGIQKKHRFTELELKSMQFYTSNEIILYNSKTYEHQSVQGGKIIFNDNESFEKIVIPKNTPCVLEKIIDENRFALSFEFGVGKLLYFTNNGDVCYSLAAKEWKDGTGTLKYANRHYETNSGTVFLTVKVKNLNHIRARQRRVTGRTIN